MEAREGRTPPPLASGFFLWNMRTSTLHGDRKCLSARPDPAILRLARALARQAAREDHAREMAERNGANPAGEDQ
jgi:hypothetical protein